MVPFIVKKMPLEPPSAQAAIVEVKSHLCDDIYITEEISLSAETQVYRAENGHKESLIIKRHTDPRAFSREVAGLLALEKIGRAPKVKRIICDHDNIIIMEYIESEFQMNSIQDIIYLTRVVAHVHAFLHKISCEKLYLRSSIFDAIASYREIGCTSLALEDALNEAYGPNYRTCCIGDLKNEHIRTIGGKVVFVDLEEMRWGGLECLDILSVLRCAPADQIDKEKLTSIVNVYCQARRHFEPSFHVNENNLAYLMSCLFEYEGSMK